MSESDLIKLYSSRILALAADMPRTAEIEDADAEVKKRAPLCGSTVTVRLCLKNGMVSNYSQNVKACALGQAAASVVGRAIVGCTVEQVITARDQLKTMLKSDGPVPSVPFDGLEVLIPARDYKNRHDSILLTLQASVEAIEQIQSAA